MKTTSSTIKFNNASSEPQLSPPLKRPAQIVEFYDDIEDIEYLSMPETPEPFVAQLPIAENHPVLLGTNSMQVPLSLMRMIEHEMKDDDYDLRTVFSHCRGMVKGTPEFNDAYIAARILSHSRFKRHCTNVQLIEPRQPENPDHAAQFVNGAVFQTNYVHSIAVMNLGHLMQYFGIWVIFLLGLQVWAAWLISALANEFLMGGRYVYLTIGLSLMMISNTWVWFHQRGKLSEAFYVPGAVLFLLAVLTITVLQLRYVLSYAQ